MKNKSTTKRHLLNFGVIVLIVGLLCIPVTIEVFKILHYGSEASGYSGLGWAVLVMPFLIAAIFAVAALGPVAVVVGIYMLILFYLYNWGSRSGLQTDPAVVIKAKNNEVTANIGLVIVLSILFAAITGFLIYEFFINNDYDRLYDVVFQHLLFAFLPEIIWMTTIIIIINRIATIKRLKNGFTPTRNSGSRTY